MQRIAKEMTRGSRFLITIENCFVFLVINAGGPGQILKAHGTGFGPNQTLFITNVDNMQVNLYDKFGEFLYDFAYKNENNREMHPPHGMFVDQNGDVFVNSYYGPTHKFTPRGAILREFEVIHQMVRFIFIISMWIDGKCLCDGQT